jgi:hypothetical protein
VHAGDLNAVYVGVDPWEVFLMTDVAHQRLFLQVSICAEQRYTYAAHFVPRRTYHGEIFGIRGRIPAEFVIDVLGSVGGYVARWKGAFGGRFFL